MKTVKAAFLKYWKWLAFAVTSLVAVALYRLFKVVVLPVPHPNNVEKKADAILTTKTEKAEEVKDTAINQANSEHASAVEANTKQLQQNVDNIQDDPSAVNAFLKDQGQKIRGQ